MRYDFSTIQALQSRARRERAEAVYRIILAPLFALLARPFKASSKSHAARPHLAGQG